MSPQIQTQLVDFETLERADAVERRSELARNVVSLFALTSETCTTEQLGTYDMVLYRLADMVEVEVRRQISDKLATLRRVPETTLQKLARDDIAVAEPILIGSVALTDADLMDIAQSLGVDHASAIADREVLSEQVTDVLIDLDDVRLQKKVLDNAGAIISGGGFEKLYVNARKNEDLQIGLSDRKDTPDRIIAALINQATDAVREKLMHSGDGASSQKMIEAGAEAFDKMSNDYWLSRYDFPGAWKAVSQTAANGQIDERLVRQFAMQDRFAEAVAAFAIVAGMPFDHAKHWLVRLDPTPFLTIAKAVGFDKITVKSMLGMGPWRLRLSVEERVNAFGQFERMDRTEARSMIQCWQMPGQDAA